MMFAVILMSNQSLSKTTICDTKAYAIIVAIQYVKECSTLVDRRVAAREFLHDMDSYHFTEAGCDYSVHIGKAA